jgi:hypothetical protein
MFLKRKHTSLFGCNPDAMLKSFIRLTIDYVTSAQFSKTFCGRNLRMFVKTIVFSMAALSSLVKIFRKRLEPTQT